jgi:uncharacterized protein YegL
MPIGLPEFVDNQENRCPVILVLDTSGSMQGAPIAALNEGIKAFKQDVLRDTQAMLSVEVSLITFGQGVQQVQDFVTIEHFDPPQLKADGLTPMGEALSLALDVLEKRKLVYKNHGIPYYRPWVFLITDGAPTDSWQAAAQDLREAEVKNRLLFFSVAVQGADMNTLKQISMRPPVLLNSLDFRDLFMWLSSSMKRVSSGKIGEAIALPPMSWGQITT